VTGGNDQGNLLRKEINGGMGRGVDHDGEMKQTSIESPLVRVRYFDF
jgi:hypothetical protein